MMGIVVIDKPQFNPKMKPNRPPCNQDIKRKEISIEYNIAFNRGPKQQFELNKCLTGFQSIEYT